jgi:hypothetical protein
MYDISPNREHGFLQVHLAKVLQLGLEYQSELAEQNTATLELELDNLQQDLRQAQTGGNSVFSSHFCCSRRDGKASAIAPGLCNREYSKGFISHVSEILNDGSSSPCFILPFIF